MGIFEVDEIDICIQRDNEVMAASVWGIGWSWRTKKSSPTLFDGTCKIHTYIYNNVTDNSQLHTLLS